ncbi:hypothetical protein SKAU_G00321860 [Synaphobranchus kaupii]|uniref:Uncharacterized protein n=1 Tax=Synaphobranchus kaupii TaxID=118154 RepID=A0A9Q1EP15_SYNKA|nr:hypothetical protein SKAU_G00321860 [Synaphobranchus kaupii]
MELSSEEILSPQTAEKLLSLLDESFVDVEGKAQPNKDVTALHASSDNQNKRKQRNELDDDINVWRCKLLKLECEKVEERAAVPENGVLVERLRERLECSGTNGRNVGAANGLGRLQILTLRQTLMMDSEEQNVVRVRTWVTGHCHCNSKEELTDDV